MNMSSFTDIGLDGFEPSTSRLSGARSNHLSYEPIFVSRFGPLRFPFSHVGGDEGNRTLDPLLAGQVLSQLSYTPIFNGLSCMKEDPSKSNNNEILRFRSPVGLIYINFARKLPLPRTVSIERR